MDAIVDPDGTAFICPECSFNGSSLPELISHLTEAHSEDTANRNEVTTNHSSTVPVEKRSRRKPAFSHQIVAQPARQSLPASTQSKVDPSSIQFWNRVVTNGKPDQRHSQPNGKTHFATEEAVRPLNHTPPRPIAPKTTLTSPEIMYSFPNTTPTTVAVTASSPSPPHSHYSQSLQTIQKNFQCRICRLTYKNFHDCTAHIRRKHEISHVQAGRYVAKLDTDVPLPPCATGHYKIRVKVKSLPPLLPTPSASSTIAVAASTIENQPKSYSCRYCSFTSHRSSDVTQHEQRKHSGHYSSYNYQNEPVDTSNGLSALLIDNIHELGEELPSSNDEMMLIEEDNDDDEDDALWRYQQEINNLPQPMGTNNHQPFTKHLKRFQCPHCEHASPTLTKLKLHIATHINVKPYMCSICGWRANLRWYIQCHARKRHPNQTFEVLQLSHEEAEQTINAYMKERGIDAKMTNRHDSKHQYQCSLCQFRSNHPRYVQQHIETNHKKTVQVNTHQGNGITAEVNNRRSSPPSNIVYQKFSTHPNFNPNRLYYCALCYRGYRWRYDVKRHHKTMHETSEDEMLKSRNFNFLEYVPHLDCLITATMSSSANHLKADNEPEPEPEMEDGDDDDLKLSIADARTVDITEDEAAALFMIEPEKNHVEQILIDDHPEESAIIFEDDRIEKSSTDLNKSQTSSSMTTAVPTPTPTPTRSGFKPFRCPHCFYRTNWRTDCLRHVRARHKIEPGHNGYIELSPEDAERTYDEYEQTYGFVVSKKVLARFTDFCQMQWEDLKRSIWERIKDKTDFEQVIIDRLRPNGYVVKASAPEPPVIVTLPTKISINKPKRTFSCSECAFRSHRINDLDKHICSKFQTVKISKSRGRCPVLLYECTKCSYKTRKQIYARQHIYFHRLKETKKKCFYFCSFCGYNHRYRTKISVHIARNHSKIDTIHTVIPCQFAFDADFTIRQTNLKRSFIEKHLKSRKIFHCIYCPYVSTSIPEYDHHRSCHRNKSANLYRCKHCSFASNSLLYTNQHMLLHTKQAQFISSSIDSKNLDEIPMSMIYKEILGKSRRYHCPFCARCSSSQSSIVLQHIKTVHAGKNHLFHNSLAFGGDLAKEILVFKTKETMIC